VVQFYSNTRHIWIGSPIVSIFPSEKRLFYSCALPGVYKLLRDSGDLFRWQTQLQLSALDQCVASRRYYDGCHLEALLNCVLRV
jgi:hypothetical protein